MPLTAELIVMWQEVLKFYKWLSKQKPMNLFGSAIFASSFLIFLSLSPGLAVIEMALYGIFFFALSYLLSILLWSLVAIIKKRQTNLYSGRPPRKADKILKLFVGTQHGVLAKITIMHMTNSNPISVQYFMDQLEGRGYIESYLALDPDDNRYVLTEKGRMYMSKRKLLK